MFFNNIISMFEKQYVFNLYVFNKNSRFELKLTVNISIILLSIF